MNRKYQILIVFLLAAIFVKLSIRVDPKFEPVVEILSPGAAAAPQAELLAADSELERPQPDPRRRNPELPPSPLDQLNSPETAPENDVRLLALLFADYSSVFKRVPLGMHEEIVAAFRGDNPRAINYIPEGHPAVNADNKIVDRWDTPFFFHIISRNAVEIISAGPDRELFTGDDIRHVPPHASVEPGLTVNR